MIGAVLLKSKCQNHLILLFACNESRDSGIKGYLINPLVLIAMRAFLFFLTTTLFSATVVAQVGVNNSNPSQALDVAGKIKLADDKMDPSEGTIRFNNATKEFEGYNGTEWLVLSVEKSGGAPTEPVFYSGTRTAIGVGNSIAANLRLYQQGISNSSPSSFSTVPVGNYFIVTSIHIRQNGVGSDFNRLSATISAGVNSSRIGTRLRLDGSNREVIQVVGALNSPVMVLRDNESFRIYNNLLSSTTTMDVDIRGFLVDDLDY